MGTDSECCGRGWEKLEGYGQHDHRASGCTADERTPELAIAASLAKAYCSDTYFRCAADSLQIHGGVGFTWEYDVHLYFKRAKSSESLLGDATHHRELVARHLAF